MQLDTAIINQMIHDALDPPTDDPSEPEPGPSPEEGYDDRTRCDALYLLARGIGACTICGDAHRPTRCPEVVAARADLPNAGAAIARQFMRDRHRFLTVLRNLDRDAWRALAEAYAVYMRADAEHVLCVWAKAVESDITLPLHAEADANAESYAGL